MIPASTNRCRYQEIVDGALFVTELISEAKDGPFSTKRSNILLEIGFFVCPIILVTARVYLVNSIE